MGHKVVTSEADETALFVQLAGQNKPYTVTWTKGRDRSLEQNRLAFKLYKEISEQLGDRTAEDVRAECKLTIATPILRSENERFREVYDRLLKGLPYEQKLELMAEPMDLPVTRVFTVKQMTAYLNEVYRRYSEQGCRLTHPESERP